MDERLLKEVLEEIENNPDAGDSDVQLAGAICSILTYYNTLPIRDAEKEPRNTLYHAKDELQAADTYHSMGLDDIARDELRHAQHFIDVLRHEAYTPEQQATVKELQLHHDIMAQKIGAFDFVPGSVVDELLQDLLNAFVAYMEDKAEYQATPTENNKIDMLQHFDAMLDMFRQVFSNLWKSVDTPEEKEKLMEFLKRSHEKHS